MKRRLLTVLVLSANLFLIGCADNEARAQLADTNSRMSQIEQNVNVLDNKVSNQKLLDVLNKLDDLQNQIAQLNGNLENLKHTQQTFQETQEQLNQGVQQQLQGVGARPVVIPSKMNSSEAAKSTNSSSQEEDRSILNDGLAKLKARDFNSASTIFSEVITTSKNSATVTDATYYLTITYAANQQYKNAVALGKKFVTANPNSSHAPDVLYTVYLAQTQLGMKKSAQNTANQLIKSYPNSSAAKKVMHKK